ncbi:MAG: hypothetical protein AAGA77_23535 [Bacteroidota bacterium]
MPEAFSFIDLFIFVGISQGIMLSTTLWKISNKNRKANMILSLLLLCATIMLTGRFLFYRYLNEWIFQWSLWVDIIILLFGPLLYTYVRRLLLDEDKYYNLPALHFLPAISLALVSAYSVITYSPHEYYELFTSGYLNYFFTLIVVVGIISNAYYLYHSFKLIVEYRKEMKSILSFRQKQIDYLWAFLIAVAIFLIAWLVSFINSSVLKYSIWLINYDSVWVSISLFVYLVGYFSLKQPELFRLTQINENKSQKERLSKSEINSFRSLIDKLMNEQKLFLDPDLTMKNLADNMQTSTNNVSWLLNSVYNVNFYDFVNGFRVDEFVRRVEQGQHVHRTILGLSKDVGFKSKSTFYKSFKNILHKTPNQFIKSMDENRLTVKS